MAVDRERVAALVRELLAAIGEDPERPGLRLTPDRVADAYAERELCAFLRRGLGLRAPVPKPPGRLERTVDRVADVAEFFTMDPSTDDTPADRARYTAVVRA